MAVGQDSTDVDIFRLQSGRIVENRDVLQIVPMPRDPGVRPSANGCAASPAATVHFDVSKSRWLDAALAWQSPAYALTRTGLADVIVVAD